MPRSRFNRVATFPGGVIVGLYTVMDMLGMPAVAPLARRLLETGPIAWLRTASQRLPAYVALLALTVPFIVAEPAKIYGLVLIGQGHFVLGLVTIVLAYLISLVLVDTIFEGARPQLRSIPWFARLLDWASLVRVSVTTYVTTSRPYLYITGLFVSA